MQKYLIENGYYVSIAQNTKEAEFLLQQIHCDLMILDLMMPGENGIDFTRRIRKEKFIPLIILSAMGETENRIEGLEVGADDYLVKPFEPRELLLRIANIIKRQQDQKDEFYFGKFCYNPNSQLLSKQGDVIFLTQSEHALLNALLLSLDKIVTRANLAAQLKINERSVDVQITRLRAKIEDNPSRPITLQTFRNQGYILNKI